MAKMRAAERDEIQGARGIPAEFVTINEWRPAYCDCVHEQAFDDRDPTNTVEFFTAHRSCVHHAGGGVGRDGRAAWAACNSESMRASRATAVLKNLGILTDAEIEREVALQFTDTPVDGVARGLEVALPARVTGPQRNQMRQILDAQFGAGRVVVR